MTTRAYTEFRAVWSSLVSGDMLVQRLSEEATLARPSISLGVSIEVRQSRAGACAQRGDRLEGSS